ncbi:hypothetical protein [Citrobacter sp. Cpo040]|uniref:hypothetical protein n=1 Tax=Citrobacter sp. Cpo040 TaxID=2985126 RepID=UPI0025764C30|nr:hypothetical protein [Citrobacter sp. Cpo040]MDM2876348.1 hypothetical protein [Citrobacter sp. Cpo040]
MDFTQLELLGAIKAVEAYLITMEKSVLTCTMEQTVNNKYKYKGVKELLSALADKDEEGKYLFIDFMNKKDD